MNTPEPKDRSPQRSPAVPATNVRRTSGLRRVVRAVATVVLTTLIACVLAELGLRWFRPVAFMQPTAPAKVDEWRSLAHRPSEIPGLAYELTPGTTSTYRGYDIRINSAGFRGPEVELVPAADVVRIAALGDSVTFGWDVQVELAWPALLEIVAKERTELAQTPRVEVLNFGVSGYNTSDEVLLLRHKVLPLRPDVVIVAYFFNDPQNVPLAPLQQFFVRPEWWQHFHLARLVVERAKQYERRRFGDGDFYQYLHAPEASCWPDQERAFDRLRDVAREADVPLLLVLFPIYPRDSTWSDYAWENLHEQVAAAGRARAWNVLDLLPAFRADGRSVKELSYDAAHPSVAGNLVAARAIMAELEQKGMLVKRAADQAR